MDLEKRKVFLINLTYYGLIFILAFIVFRYGLSLATPFVVAFAIAYVLKKPIEFLCNKVKLPWKISAIFVVVLFYGTVGTLITLAGIKIVSWFLTLIGDLPTMYETHLQPFFMDILWNIEGIFMKMDPTVVASLDAFGTKMILSLGDLMSSLSVKAMGFATGVAAAIPGLFIKLVLMIISTFFIAIDYEQLTGFCLRQMNERVKTVFFQIKEYIVGTLWVCIRSYALIMSITFVELSIGLSIIGIKHAVLVALCISIFDILPVLGTGGIMIPWTVLTAIQGNYPLALGLLILYLVITVIRNIIEPKIVGSQLGLHPVVTLCSMFIGAQLFGVVGLFGFPIGLSLVRYLNEHEVIRLFR